MEEKSMKFVNTKLLIISIPAINLLLFLVYYFSHPSEPFWGQVWTYFDSGIFKLVTGSLIVPIFLSILEKRYKFFENIQKQREDRLKAIEEENKRKRQEAISETFKMWQDLYNMTSEIIFFNPKKGDMEPLREIMLKLTFFSSSAEHIINKWSRQFPDLNVKDQNIFLELINIIFQSGFSIASYILKETDEKKRQKMQSVLFQILDQIKNIGNHRFLNIFSHLNQLMDLKESGASKNDIDQVRQLLTNELELLKSWTNALIEKEKAFDNFLSPNKGIAFDNIRLTARKIEEWLKQDEKRQIYESDDYADFEQQYYAIDLQDRLDTLYNLYTLEYMEELANWLSFQFACIYVRNRAFSTW